MNVLRAVQVFSPQVTAALEHLQQNSRVCSLLFTFRDATSTINFMTPPTMEVAAKCPSPEKTMTDYCGCKMSFAATKHTVPVLFSTNSTVEVTRFLLRKGVSYVLTRKFNSDPIEALFGQLRFMCGGNGALDARAVTTALDHIVTKKALPSKGVAVQDEDAEEAAASRHVQGASNSARRGYVGRTFQRLPSSGAGLARSAPGELRR
ncbi:hypothetical protein HPB47_017336 [Ixodes persulcatus]|uniref:Uncharacterized protein n=1 Tax=Ixodes persulcatus TaxID=34615 RepID=A0AC60QNJ6_IXOPE|nr:hypothetical protein HPB47_017336 [Ixodes persulcatus]